MSILDRHKKEVSKKGKLIGAKVTQEEYDLFNLRCEELGLSVSDALRIFVQSEIKNVEQNVKQNSEQNVKQEDKQEVKQEDKQKVKPSVKQGRFNLKEYSKGGKTPCPSCNTWVTTGNYSRHCKTHDTTSEQLIMSNLDKVREMLKA